MNPNTGGTRREKPSLFCLGYRGLLCADHPHRLSEEITRAAGVIIVALLGYVIGTPFGILTAHIMEML